MPETGRRQLGVAHRVLNRLVTKVGLNGAGIDAVIGQLKAGRMPQHVRMDGKWQLRGVTSSFDHPSKPGSGHRSAPLGAEYVSARLTLPLEPPQCPDLGAT